MTLLLALALLAQVLSPASAYLTADPVNPDRLGLATLEGRFMVELGADCEGTTADMNVSVLATSDTAALLSNGCNVLIDQRMSDVPCFTLNDVCDVAAEADE